MRALAATLLLACPASLPAQEPAAPPARPLAATEAANPTHELLATLRAIRQARQEARRKAEAFELERQVLAEEIAVLQARLKSLQEEQRRLQAEERVAREHEAAAQQAAGKDRALLQEAATVFEGARARLGPDLLPSGRPLPVRLAEAVSSLFRSLEIQAGRLREVAVTETEIRLGEQVVPVLLLRLGGAVRLWRSLEGQAAGWIEGSGEARRLPQALAALEREIGRAVEMLRRRRGPGLLPLPIPLDPEEGR